MQNRTNGIIIVLLVIIAALLVIVIFRPQKINTNPTQTTLDNSSTDPKISATVTGNADDLISISIIPGQAITDNQVITGAIKGGYFFEGSMGVELLDAQKNKIDSFLVQATSDWMTVEPVTFTTTIDTDTAPKGAGYLRFIKSSQKDGSTLSYIDVPIII